MTHPKPGRVTSCLVEVRVRVSPTCGLAVDEVCKYACVSLLVAAAQRQVFLTLTGTPSNRKTNHDRHHAAAAHARLCARLFGPAFGLNEQTQTWRMLTARRGLFVLKLHSYTRLVGGALQLH